MEKISTSMRVKLDNAEKTMKDIEMDGITTDLISLLQIPSLSNHQLWDCLRCILRFSPLLFLFPGLSFPLDLLHRSQHR